MAPKAQKSSPTLPREPNLLAQTGGLSHYGEMGNLCDSYLCQSHLPLLVVFLDENFLTVHAGLPCRQKFCNCQRHLCGQVPVGLRVYHCQGCAVAAWTRSSCSAPPPFLVLVDSSRPHQEGGNRLLAEEEKKKGKPHSISSKLAVSGKMINLGLGIHTQRSAHNQTN